MPTPAPLHSATRPRPVDVSAIPEPAAIAEATLEGFNRHYALFRDCASAAKSHFEAGNWLAIAHTSQDRIDFYDRRVAETVVRLEREFGCDRIDEARWEAVKRHYIGLLIDHKQPECAETFFNSVSCKILHRTYFHNRCLFVRPAMSTEHIDADPPSYRSYYPRQHGLRQALIDVVLDFRLKRRFADFRRDLRNLLQALRSRFPRPFVLEANHQLQVLSSLFFRNRTAYIVGRVINGFNVHPFVVPIKHDASGRLYVDALLMDPEQIALLFSANRAYFLVDMEVPSAYVTFLRSMVPVRTEAELYTMVGLQKQGKTLFFRDFLHHLKHSTDSFIVAPGIKGLVMTVFTLPSYPYVFKVIRDKIAPSKDTTPDKVKEKYLLVKHHDRVGRVAFYDYDEIDYITDCSFRRIPPAPPGYDEMDNEVWYPVAERDVFPEEFATFLLTDPGVRADFLAHHADLLEAEWWQAAQARLAEGGLPEVLSYPERVRFLAPAAR